MDYEGQNVGLVELVEIDYIHRRAEFQIIIDPAWQNHGFATAAAKLAMAYAFDALNLYKLYLVVDNENVRAIHVYSSWGSRPRACSSTSSLPTAPTMTPRACASSSTNTAAFTAAAAARTLPCPGAARMPASRANLVKCPILRQEVAFSLQKKVEMA